MANNKYTVMELEAIKHLCKCVNSVASLPTDLIADTNVATNTTYSSYKIDAEMSALENDIQRYVDTALAGLNKLTKEVIDDKALVVKENVLYLYKDPTSVDNNYMQMMLINGVVVELGATEVDFSNIYSKTEVNDKFALKIDLDVLTTSFNDLVTSVDNKIDKDSIVTVLDDTVTDGQVASALLTKTEFDKTNAKLGELCNKKIYCGEAWGTIVNGVLSVKNPIGKTGNAIVTMKYSSQNRPIGYSITAQVTVSSLNFYFRRHRESNGAELEAFPPDGTEIVISYMIFY